MDTHDQREYAHCRCSGEADEHYKPIIAELEAERDQLKEAAKRFLSTKGSQCVSALFDLLKVLGMDLTECAARDTEQEIQALTAERDRYKAERKKLRHENRRLRHAVSGVAEWFETTSDDMGHDCGNFDGGSPESCEACQYKRTAEYYSDVLAGKKP